jgi:hypothetical protein
MGAIVIVIIIVAAFILGHFYIRKQRKVMLEERANKLKVAEGGREQKPAKKNKKRKKRWFKSSNKWDLPDFLLQDIQTDVPVMTEALLQARHTVNTTYAAAAQASSQLASANGRLEAVVLPPRGSINIERWLQHVLEVALDARRALRAERDAQIAYTAAIFKHGDAVGDLSGFLAGLDKFDLEELDDDSLRILEIARTAANECKYSPTRPELSIVKPEPETSNAEFDALLEKLFERCADLATSGIELSRAYAAAKEAFRNSEALAADPELPELEKPNDAEVSGWATAAIDWATCLHESQIAAQGTLPSFAEALALAKTNHALVREVLTRFDELDSRLEEEEKARREAELRSSSWSWRRSFDSKEESPAAGSAQAGEATTALPVQKSPLAPSARRRRAAAMPMNWGDDGEFTFRRGRRQKEEWAPPKTQPARVTDLQLCRYQVGLKVAGLVEALLKPGESAWDSYSKRPITQVAKVASTEDLRLSTQLRAAIRKLGFAVAQHASAASKLKAAREDGHPSNEAPSPSLDDASVDAYIRAHRLWVDGGYKTEAAVLQRNERISQMEQQVSERQQQVSDGVSALLEMIPSEEETVVVSADLAVNLAVAQLLARKHKVNAPAAAPLPAPAAASSSSQDRKKKNKRRRR